MDDFKEILSKINSDYHKVVDGNGTNDEDLSTTALKEDLGYEKRDITYTTLLDHFVKSHKDKTKANGIYKAIFFSITMGTYISLIFGAIFIIRLVAIKQSTNISDIVVILGEVASVLSAVIVLPKIIAQYLFPPNEDSSMIQIVKSLLINDQKIRNSSKKHNNCK